MPQMKPISDTAFYCCGVRMEDAERERPVCGDRYARVFMSERGMQVYERFKDETGPNASNVARHRVIDDLLRKDLDADPGLLVVIIGAGFDSRAFRLGGGVWLELDEPQVIGYKEERLPVSGCANEVHRIPIDFASESLEQKLAPFADRQPVVFVIEGVFMYLQPEDIRRLLETLRHLFPQHRLICDLMSRRFIDKYSHSVHEKIKGLGAAFRFVAEHPETLFTDAGYRCVDNVSIVEAAASLRAIRIPRFILRLFLRTLVDGYRIYVFDAARPSEY